MLPRAASLLAGKVALVAGATRGAGRAIAVELGRAGRSEIDRPETIEETGELITAAGGEGIALRIDHLELDQVRGLVQRIDSDHERLGVGERHLRRR